MSTAVILSDLSRAESKEAKNLALDSSSLPLLRMTPPLSSPLYGELVEPLGEEIIPPLLEGRVGVRSLMEKIVKKTIKERLK